MKYEKPAASTRALTGLMTKLSKCVCDQDNNPPCCTD